MVLERLCEEVGSVDTVSRSTDRLQTVRRGSGLVWETKADVGMGGARDGGSSRASRSEERVPVRSSVRSEAKGGGKGERLAEDEMGGAMDALERGPEEVSTLLPGKRERNRLGGSLKARILL
jgi:hypothetical protein